MEITTQQAKSGYISVFADGEYVFSAAPDYWYSLNIYDNDEISEERLREIENDINIAKCCNSAYKYIARRAHSIYELKLKLLKKYDEDTVNITVEKALELGLLDDREYAINYADELKRVKAYAPTRIKAELFKRGISKEDCENALSVLEFSPADEIEQLLSRKFKNSLNSEKGIQRTVSSLMRMGYKYSDIRSAIDEYITDEVYIDE